MLDSHHKKILHVQGQTKEKPQQNGMEAKSHLESNPLPITDTLKQILCALGPREPTETEQELSLSVSCGSMNQQWPASGAGALGAADPGVA